MGGKDKQGGEEVMEYFGDKPPSEEPKMKGSLFWPAIRVIAILATAVYLTAVVVVPLVSTLYSSLPSNTLAVVNVCGFETLYLCGSPSLYNGEINFTFLQDTGASLYNVTFYAVPFSANFTFANASQFPRSASISTLFSGATRIITLSGGASGYQPKSSGEYSTNIVMVYSSTPGGRLLERTLGYVTVTAG
ncbi:MAG: hypothetical protein KGH57_00280 [Candidatus Micrarchaeota archaeon]|nr:hypothetical protein [Candidatus Micrarchaeota archaeon]